MDYKIKINGEEYEVNIRKMEGSTAHLTVNDVEFEVEVEGLLTNPTRAAEQPVIKPVQPEIPAAAPPIIKSMPKLSDPSSLSSGHGQRSPLPGVIIEIPVKIGDRIKAGQVLVVIEAMKMENNIEAERDGIIEKINCNKGDSVSEGDVLFVIK